MSQWARREYVVWDGMGGHPVQGLIRYKTGADGMVYRYGIQPWYTRRVKQT